jgi:multidrug efflux pump subunit AcrB
VTSIFFVMVLLFNSLSLPIVTLMLVPVSFIWVLFVFGISGLNVGVAAMVGLLGLVGVLVNGALVMIDQIRKLHISHGDGGNRLATRHIVEGAVMRLRPLLITALTTIVGLGPAAYGIAGTQPSTEALLLVMFWGVAVGAVVTLFTLPLFLRLDSLLKEKIAQLRS